MYAYIFRRLLLMIPTIFLATIIVFLAVRFIPGSVVEMMAAEYEATTQMDVDAIEKAMGLDVSVPVQYGRWLGVIPNADGNISGVLQGDLGKSLWRPVPVIEQIATRWPITFQLGLMALIIAQLIALPIGVYSALRQDTWGDYIFRSFAILCISVPYFWVGTMVIVFPSIWWGYMPSIYLIPFSEDPIGNLKMFIIPAIVLGMFISGITMRMTRTMMLEVLRQDYIRTAWAKGLRERVVIIRHALKNALIPVITIVGLQVHITIGGTVILEQIFCLPGMGRLLIDGTQVRDYTLVSGIMLIYGIAMVFINLMVDLSYGFLDPRIRYG